MSSTTLTEAIEIQKSLSAKSNFSGPSYEAPKIIDELDALVELGLAVKAMDELQGTKWQPPQFPWTMSKLFTYAEKLRVTDLGEYLFFIHGLEIILQKLAIEEQIASIPIESSSPISTPFKL